MAYAHALLAVSDAESAEEARREARSLWERLVQYSPAQRRALVEGTLRDQSWALSELVCQKSLEAAADRADRALALAELAVRIAELSPGEFEWCQRVQGYAWACPIQNPQIHIAPRLPKRPRPPERLLRRRQIPRHPPRVSQVGIHLEEGRPQEVKALARQMTPIFKAQGVHREALAALRLFREAAERDAVTVEMARDLVSYLDRARHDPTLRFEAFPPPI